MKILSESILENKNLAPLPDAIEGGRLPALISGLGPVHRANLGAALAEKTKRPLWVISPDDTAAEAMAGDLAGFLGTTASVLVGRDFSFYDMESVSRQGEQRRLKVLDALAEGDEAPVVCTVAALLQRTMTPAALRRACLSVKTGDSLPMEDGIDHLLRLGYRPAEQVEGPGQFARRGGILDVWPGGAASPARIEFWGDDIDSIHSFDPDSQRRTEEIKSLRLIPAAETLPSLAEGGPSALAEKLGDIEKRLNRNAVRFDVEKLRRSLRADGEALENNRSLAAADKYMELIYPAFAIAVDYIPADALVLIDQPGKCAQQARSYLKQGEENLRLLIEGGVLPGRLGRFYMSWEEALSRLEDYPVVMADAFTVGSYPLPPKTIMAVSAKQLPSYAGSGQTAAADVRHWLGEGYRCVVLAGDSRRAQAMEELLRQEEAGRIYRDSELSALPEPGCCAVAVGSLSSGIEYPQIKLAILADTQIMKTGLRKSTTKRKRALPAGARLGSYEDLTVGDLVVHENYGIGRFAGIVKMRTDGVEKDYVKICYAGTDSIYVPATQLDMVTKYIGGGEDAPVKLSRLGGGDWNRARRKAKAAAKEMAGELIALYAARQRTPGHAFGPDTPWQREFEDAFEYTETGDQLRCAEEVKGDMEKPVPMDRLLCGDVGYGKTEVALRAVMKCVLDGYQAAILVPTTVLAQQHYQTAVSRFFGFSVKIGVLSRFTTAAQLKQTLREMESGACDIVIGTHRLLQKDVKFKKLGLLVVDEEQRFGVSHKEHIKEMAKQVDVLTLSATPIPRTLNMALSGLRDMSTLEEPPHDRLPVQTYVMEHDWGVLCDAIRRELARGGQVYYLHNRVDSITRTAAKILELLPDITIDVAHGRMDEAELSAAMDKVIQGQTQVLVCTTIIETGIDIPNVNTLIIEDADKMGLAQLHQIRGRVGRSARRASAYLTYRKDKVLTEVAEKRLEAIREFAEFNSGFRIAMRDLEIRGAGNVLGAEQSGHMIDVGYDMYLKLLEEAVLEEKGEPVPTRTDCAADLAVNANIPDTYIKSAAQRVDIYRRIALIRSEAEADDITDELCDRFGDPPPAVNTLIQVALLRGEASSAGISDISQKGGVVRFDFALFDFERISALYSRPEWKGRIKVEAGSKPAVSLKLKSGRRILEEARAFVGEYKSAKEE
ncbi:MAG: transcription-repair coupling factor [Oscillospiraceae bacterium]|nr:transcription-repair coupling factor [Oscillospiraceae bacterium]